MEATMDAPILICYDRSAHARRAIETAAELFPSSRAVVLDVAPVLTEEESYFELSPFAPNFEELNREAALEQSSVGVQLAERAGIRAEGRADVSGRTWDGVVAVAEEIDAAVIVIGSRGLNGAKALLRHSLSHQVAQHAGRPVLIVPPHKAA
jgi:nucleotide-binding universal stress UspA family protein